MQQQSDDTPPEDTIGPTAEGKEPLIVFEDDEFIRKWWDAVNDDDDDDDDNDNDDDNDDGDDGDDVDVHIYPLGQVLCWLDRLYRLS